MSGTRTYITWSNMKARCDRHIATSYEHYGERGISYDPRWSSFLNFLSDMGESPDGFSIERLDVNGDYCKDNCIWASSTTQARNKTNTHWVTYKGERFCLTDAVERFVGIEKYDAVKLRVYKGWSIEEAIETPFECEFRLTERGKEKLSDLYRFDFREKRMNLREISDETGIRYSTLRSRLNRSGLSIEAAVDLGHPVKASRLTEDGVVEIIQKFKLENGRLPTAASGEFAGENFGVLDRILKNGHRGLPGGSSIAKLKRKHKLV